MERRLNVEAITPLVTEWTCKVLVVDKFRPRESKNQTVHEEQVSIVLYRDDITRYTIVEPVANREVDEAPLPPPMKLNTLAFSDLQYQLPDAEFDLLAVVANCSAMKYTADQTKRYRVAIVMDNNKKSFMFTIWNDLADNERDAILRQAPCHSCKTGSCYRVLPCCKFDNTIQFNNFTQPSIRASY